MESSYQSRVLEELKRKEFGDPEPERPRKRKGPSGPNPLSCLASKKKKPRLEDNNKANKGAKKSCDKAGDKQETPTTSNAAAPKEGGKKRKRVRKRKNNKNVSQEKAE